MRAFDVARILDHAPGVTPADAEQLSGYLAKGLGRAHQLLEADSSKANADALLEACLTNLAYDRQIEGSRAHYLYGLVEVAGLSDRLASALVNSLDGAGADDYAISQRWELAGLLARDGVVGIRDAMYSAIARLVDRWAGAPREVLPPTEPARQLIVLDGIAGARFAFAQLGRVAAADPDFWDDGELLAEARSRVGTDLDTVLADARGGDRNVDAYLRAVEKHDAARVAQRESKADHSGKHDAVGQRMWDQSWSEAQRAIERQVRGTGQVGFMWHQWGKRASAAELVAAARSLVELPREDLDLLRPFLCVFARRAFPLDPQPIIDLLDDPREKVAWFAANALAHVTHPAVRSTALRMAEEGPLRERAIDLLAANWESGDERVVERLLRTEGDIDRIHMIGTGLRVVVEKRLSPELVPALLLGYEKTPCSECRGHFVDALVRISALPDELRAECRWDARQETREVVAGPT